MTRIPKTPGFAVPEGLDPSVVRIVLCDADDNLFPSEAPAFTASTEVTNDFLERIGVDRRWTPEELRRAAMGRNFRSVVLQAAADAGVPVETSTDPVEPAEPSAGVAERVSAAEMEWWVAEEKRRVSDRLREVLRPDPEVLGPLASMGERYRLAAVSSSALSRLEASFTAAGLTGLLPPQVRYSAEDTPPVPTSKPDPTVYRIACEREGVAPTEAVAVEDSLTGATAAVRAGIPTVGNLQFVLPVEREARIAAFHEVGVAAVVENWLQLASLLRVDEAEGDETEG
ncbi:MULTISPECIES: HAD family hydrolase [Protofrankia]|uniref:HAD-superfamily hydrolase, subfamily IA, variant 3 n=1 Tax=Candidatus Protofrankia datiscae TaxID=2716812 RepID=F8B2V5_9ACTN|nr:MULTISPECIES: HAD family phosphatase [Protofrankia]AEH08937.1 HAD-superfamily hydrolase, subfamily IA, variant 3 [Candidatus Protofrankia datiscae]